MPLYECKAPSLPVRSFRSLVFHESLEIILESPGQVKAKGCSDIALVGSVIGIHTDALKTFLKAAKKGETGLIRLNETLTIDTEDKLILMKGYKLKSFAAGETGQLNETYICCSETDTVYAIEYTFDNKYIITTLEYLYHMITCV